MRCKTCHYSLAGLTEHRCPECGNAFDPNDPSTYETDRTLRWGRLSKVVAVVSVALCLALAMFFTFFHSGHPFLFIALVVPLITLAACAATPGRYESELSTVWKPEPISWRRVVIATLVGLVILAFLLPKLAR